MLKRRLTKLKTLAKIKAEQMFGKQGGVKLAIPKEIYEIIDYINAQDNSQKVKEKLFGLIEAGIEQGDDGLESSDLLGGEGFALSEIPRRN